MKERVQELDALRGIAALLVIVFHFSMGRPEANLGLKFGVTGVDLFFLISGFVIFMSLKNVKSGLEFVINRFSRLYPTYWTCVTITFLLQLFYSLVTSQDLVYNFWDYLANMTMFQYYFMIHNLDGAYWSMPIEMLFYISILIVYSLKKMQFIAEIGVLALVLTIILDLVLIPIFPILEFIHKSFTLINHFPLFLAGIVFYKILNNADNKFKLYAVLILCFATQLLLFDKGGRSFLFINKYQYSALLFLYFALFILFVNNFLKIINNKYTLFLGKISFALYLIHQYFATVIIIPFLLKYNFFNFWSAAFLALILSILLAILITYKIEIPTSKKLNQFLKAKFLKS